MYNLNERMFSYTLLSKSIKNAPKRLQNSKKINFKTVASIKISKVKVKFYVY